MADTEYALHPAADLPAVAADEVASYRLINGEPRPEDIRHLAARVRVQMEPIEDGAIEAAIVAAISARK